MRERYTGVRSEEAILAMLDKAERKQNMHYTELQIGKRKKRIYHMRQYKGLEGVVKSLRWALGDKDIEHPLE
tara:strand:+ start:36 stop:251 length:216 start_codon:yes stop_codon:yes gene_type:complete